MTHQARPIAGGRGHDHDHDAHDDRHSHDRGHDHSHGGAGSKIGAALREVFAPHSHDAADSLDGALGSGSSGLYYMASTDTSTCAFGSDIGSPDNPVVAVVNGPVRFNGGNFFGMLFIRWAGTGTAPDPMLDIQGNGNVFGSVVVDGNVDGHGTFTIVYVDTSSGTPGSKLPPTTRFARLPGSWIDNSTGF
jgi:hypothetical protein